MKLTPVDRARDAETVRSCRHEIASIDRALQAARATVDVLETRRETLTVIIGDIQRRHNATDERRRWEHYVGQMRELQDENQELGLSLRRTILARELEAVARDDA